MVAVTIEAAQDFRALIAGMSDEQVQSFLVSTITTAGAKSLTVDKNVVNDNGKLLESFTLRFITESE